MPDETITIEVYDHTFMLSKLERHILYTADEGREPSARLYSPAEIETARHDLHTLKLLGDYGFLTALGLEVVEACRTRPRS